MKYKAIQVFEHEVLPVDDERFFPAHFRQLVLYNERHGNQFFSVGDQKIFFKNYVGVIQVGSLVIEILPKADNTEGDVNKWHMALLNMLRECRYLKLKSLTNAHLRLRSASLIDLYFDSFLHEVESLIHKGLTKRYRFREHNLPKLKGKILFSRQIAKNIVHKERFYTSHQVYDRNNIFNQIIKKALTVLRQIATNHHLHSRASRQLLDFEEISDIHINAKVFQQLSFNRKTEHYRYAIKLAKLIILQYAPDLKGGHEDILAILFDMNRLFEQFIYLQLKKAEEQYRPLDLTVSAQESRVFWQGRTIRPDILLQYKVNNIPKKLIIDTKWKVLNSYQPSDEDLRQMYAYNLHFGVERSVLLYPKVDLESTEFLQYEPSVSFSFDHSCRLYFVNLFDNDGSMLPGIGGKILCHLELPLAFPPSSGAKRQ